MVNFSSLLLTGFMVTRVTAFSYTHSFCCRLFYSPQTSVLCLSVLAGICSSFYSPQTGVLCLSVLAGTCSSFYSPQTGVLCFSVLTGICCSLYYNGCLFQLGLLSDRFVAIFCTVVLTSQKSILNVSKPLSQDLSPSQSPGAWSERKKSFHATM